MYGFSDLDNPAAIRDLSDMAINHVFLSTFGKKLLPSGEIASAEDSGFGRSWSGCRTRGGMK